MEWYNIVTLIVGALGGTAVVIGIYKARPEKEGIVVKNMREMLDEAHKLYDEMKSERNAVREELNEYKDETEKRFDKLETKEEIEAYDYKVGYPPMLEF
jgi:spermidine/putrescine-binding protein